MSDEGSDDITVTLFTNEPELYKNGLAVILKSQGIGLQIENLSTPRARELGICVDGLLVGDKVYKGSCGIQDYILEILPNHRPEQFDD